MTITNQAVERRTIEAALHTLLMVEDDVAGQGLRDKLRSLQTKLTSGQLHLAVLGQMKRGKSSFINAILGGEILPTGVLPVTAVITEIRYGPAPDATIIYSTGGMRERVDLSILADYITEAGNPGNKKQVASVEIAYPSTFLEDGIVLIDTPGIGSTHIHNTQTTEKYLEQVDAGIVVLSMDPPITEVESNFLKDIKGRIPKLFFIVNKTDVASSEEAQNIKRFLESELERLQFETAEIFLLSARNGLQEKRQASGAVLSSGLEAFERRLRSFLSKEKTQVLVRSVALDVWHIARMVKFAAAIGVRAMEMSPQELQSKRLALDELLERTEAEVRELQVLLRQHSMEVIARVERDVGAQALQHIAEMQQHLKQFQSEHPRATGRSFGALLEKFTMAEVETAFRRWRVREDQEVQLELDALSLRFVTQANEILGRLEQTAGTLFQVPVERLSVSCSLRVESRLHYKVERVFDSLDSFFLLLPRFLLRPVVLRRVRNSIPRLLDMNAGRIRYDYVERLQFGMTQFEKELRGAIMMVTESLQPALRAPQGEAPWQLATLNAMDSVAEDCSRILQWKVPV